MALFSFNSADHAAPRAQYDILPRGWYRAILIESGAAATGAGGQRLTFVAQITAPEWAKGRKVFMGFNVAHPTSEEAVRIGNEQLSGLSIAVGVPSWGNTEQLHNKEFFIRLKVRKGGVNERTKEEYDDSNEPQGFDNLANFHDMAKQPAQAGTAAAPAAAFPVASPVVAAPGVPAGLPAAASFPGAVAGAPAVAAPGVAAPAVIAPAVAAAPAVPSVVATAPAQPWEQPQAVAAQALTPVTQAPAAVVAPAVQTAAVVAPVVAPVVSAAAEVAAPVVANPFEGWAVEQLNAWVAQNPAHPLAAQASAQAAASQPVVAPVVAPVAAPTVAAQPDWAQQSVAVQPQAAAASAAVAPVTEAPHPAQAQLPPWQQPAATPQA